MIHQECRLADISEPHTAWGGPQLKVSFWCTFPHLHGTLDLDKCEDLMLNLFKDIL